MKYWGGKQQLAARIISLIPQHVCYSEPFFGGGAVFFEKPKSSVEIINDVNDNIINFYRVIKRQFSKLHDEIDATLYSESQWKLARQLWEEAVNKDAVLRAWAVFVLSHQSFSGSLGGSWAFSDTRNCAQRFKSVKDYFDVRYVRRLDGVQIFCRDALSVIKVIDSLDTFHFIDPPYYNSDMGHYGGYTEEQFRQLLEVLSGIKGKFLLTTYQSDILNEFKKRNGWHTIENRMHLAASNTVGKMKTEVFTFNYAPPAEQHNLFDALGA
jgi:DNA adenine methylase